MKKNLPILFVLITVLTPVLFITTGMRIALSPVFYNLEYRLPNFPDDEYGMTMEERLKWAEFSIDFIAGRLQVEEFASATFPDQSQLFNDREISHMVDVRNLTVIMLWVWRCTVVIFLFGMFSGLRFKLLYPFIESFSRGAKITVGLIFSILFLLILNFNQLFTLFHRIFFEGDTWLFYLSDTLIRLFPIKFWQDLFIFIGGWALLMSLVVLVSRKRFQKTDPSFFEH